MTTPSQKGAPLILIVDDVESNRYFFSTVLKDAGFSVVEADSGVQSLLRLEPKPDLIILDINLPDINGYEICRQLKNSHLKNIPVIQTSASFVTKDDYLKGIYSGAEAYLTSPVDPAALVECVKNCLKRQKNPPTL